MRKYLSSILSLILALAMVFSLVACGSDDSSSDDDDDDNSKSSSSQSSSDESDTSSDDESSEDESSDDELNDDEKTDDSNLELEGEWTGMLFPDYDGEMDEDDEFAYIDVVFEGGVMTVTNPADDDSVVSQLGYVFDGEELQFTGHPDLEGENVDFNYDGEQLAFLIDGDMVYLERA